MNVEEIARVCHEANRALQIIQNDPSIPVSDEWDVLDEHYISSAIDGVQGVLNGNTPEQSHEQWMRFKLADGWVPGPTKDADSKEHPLLVPYADLPESAKVKDALFVGVVRALSAV